MDQIFICFRTSISDFIWGSVTYICGSNICIQVLHHKTLWTINSQIQIYAIIKKIGKLYIKAAALWHPWVSLGRMISGLVFLLINQVVISHTNSFLTVINHLDKISGKHLNWATKELDIYLQIFLQSKNGYQAVKTLITMFIYIHKFELQMRWSERKRCGIFSTFTFKSHFPVLLWYFV